MSLVDVVARILEEPADTLTDESSRDSVGNWTSMRHVALLVALETEYGVKFSNPEMTAMRSLGDLRASLTAKGATGL